MHAAFIYFFFFQIGLKLTLSDINYAPFLYLNFGQKKARPI